jgi:hypothetical protein
MSRLIRDRCRAHPGPPIGRLWSVNEPAIQLTGLSKTFGSIRAVSGIDLTI